MMSKSVFVYPCNSYVGKAVSKAFTTAGHSVSGLVLGSDEPPSCVDTFVRAGEHGAAAAQRQLLLSADVVVFDLLGNEGATRDAVVALAGQPPSGREALFVAISSPLVWAATRPNPEAVFAAAAAAAAAAGEGPAEGRSEAASTAPGTAGTGGESGEAPWSGARRSVDGEAVDGANGVGGGGARRSGEGERHDGFTPPLSPSVRAPTFRSPEDLARRTPYALARSTLSVEQLVLRSGRRGSLRTAVVCPGLLYGEGEDDSTFFGAFKTAWIRQCSAPGRSCSGGGGLQAPPRMLVYGRGSNILPTLHVVDLAAYVLALSSAAGLSGPPPAALATMSPGQPNSPAPGAALPPLPPPLPPPLSVQQTSVTPNLFLPLAAIAKPGSAPASGAGAAAAAAAAAFGRPPSSPSVTLGSPGVGGVGVGAGSGAALASWPGYFLVSDGSRHTQSEVVQAIAAEMGLGPDDDAIEYVPSMALPLQPAPLRSRMLLDLTLATTPLPAPLPPFAPSRPSGLPAHVAATAAEFRSARRLTPLRLLVTGPPLSGKTHLSRRLAARYGLTYISVPILLAATADPAAAAAAGLTPVTDAALLRAAQAEVATAPPTTSGSKDKERERAERAAAAAAAAAAEGGVSTGWAGSGRVTARTLGALLAAALADPRCPARCRGFVLDGFPRSAGQARGAFFTLQAVQGAAPTPPPAPEPSHAKHHKGRPGDKMPPGTPPGGAHPATPPPAPPVHGPDTYEVPPGMRLAAHPLTAPTHVLELEAGEEALRARLAAINAAVEESAARLSCEPSAASDLGGTTDRRGGGANPPKNAPKGAKKGADGAREAAAAAVAAALGHNTEVGFGRRMAAFTAWRAEDEADLKARAEAAQAAWQAEQKKRAEEQARAEAEAATLKAKRRRARAAAAAAAASLLGAEPLEDVSGGGGGGSPNGTLGRGTDEAAGGDDAAAPPEPAGPELPKHGGLIALCLDCGAGHARLSNPTAEEGPFLMAAPAVQMPLHPPPTPSSGTLAVPLPGSVAAVVAAAAAALAAPVPPAVPQPLTALEAAVEAFVGPPHNFDGFPDALTRRPSRGTVASTGTSSGGLDGEGQAAQAELIAQRNHAAEVAERLAPAAAATGAGAEASYQLRLRGGRGEAVRRYLLQRVMPVVTAALAEAALDHNTKVTEAKAVERVTAGGEAAAAGGGGGRSSRTGGTGNGDGVEGSSEAAKQALLAVARALTAAAAAEEERFVDPYDDASYGIQLAKIEAKKAREAARAAAAAAKAEREAAARQQAAEAGAV